MPVAIINLIEQLKYIGIFIGTFVEGPAVGLFAGFLSRMGFVNIILAYIVHVTADLSADFFYYFSAYKGKKRFFNKFNFSEKNIVRAEKIQKLFYTHPTKIIILGKLTHIIGLPILLGAGMMHYSWRRFLLFDLAATLIKSLILLSLGYYLAEFWTKANDVISYASWFIALFIAIIIIYFIIKKLIQDLWGN